MTQTVNGVIKAPKPKKDIREMKDSTANTFLQKFVTEFEKEMNYWMKNGVFIYDNIKMTFTNDNIYFEVKYDRSKCKKEFDRVIGRYIDLKVVHSGKSYRLRANSSTWKNDSIKFYYVHKRVNSLRFFETYLERTFVYNKSAILTQAMANAIDEIMAL